MTSGLEGIKVVEVAQWDAGPAAGAILAEFGADVVHVEHPARGDSLRGLLSGPGVMWSAGTQVNYAWELVNHNKRSVAIDIAKKQGIAIIHKLVQNSDIFLSNLRPFELAKYDLEYKTLSKLNPRLIYAMMTGYGRKGPDCNMPGYDYAAFGNRSGISTMLPSPGMPPVVFRPAFGDHLSAMGLAGAISLALFVRERTGVGQEVDVSLFGIGTWALAYDIEAALITGKNMTQESRENMPNPITNYYRCQDGKWVFTCNLQSDLYWSSFCKAIERPDLENDSRFNSHRRRMENNKALIAILDEVFAARPFEEWKKRLTDFGTIWAPAQTPVEAANDAQAWANGHFVKFDHPVHGPISLVTNPWKLSKTPASVWRRAPEMGEHTEEVLLDLGYSWEDMARLKEEGVIL